MRSIWVSITTCLSIHILMVALEKMLLCSCICFHTTVNLYSIHTNFLHSPPFQQQLHNLPLAGLNGPHQSCTTIHRLGIHIGTCIQEHLHYIQLVVESEEEEEEEGRREGGGVEEERRGGG